NGNPGEAVGLVPSRTCDDPATLVRWADAQLGLLPSLERGLETQGLYWDWADGEQLGIDGRPALYAKLPAEEDKPDNVSWPEFGPHNFQSRRAPRRGRQRGHVDRAGALPGRTALRAVPLTDRERVCEPVLLLRTVRRDRRATHQPRRHLRAAHHADGAGRPRSHERLPLGAVRRRVHQRRGGALSRGAHRGRRRASLSRAPHETGSAVQVVGALGYHL